MSTQKRHAFELRYAQRQSERKCGLERRTPALERAVEQRHAEKYPRRSVPQQRDCNTWPYLRLCSRRTAADTSDTATGASPRSSCARCGGVRAAAEPALQPVIHGQNARAGDGEPQEQRQYSNSSNPSSVSSESTSAISPSDGDDHGDTEGTRRDARQQAQQRNSPPKNSTPTRMTPGGGARGFPSRRNSRSPAGGW